MRFLDRDSELSFLEKEYEKNRASFIPIYGRRRIGKTRLMNKFMNNKKSIYYLAAQESKEEQAKGFRLTIANELQDEFLKQSSINNWKDLFSYLQNNLDKSEKLVIAIDEVTYMIKRDKSFPSYLQRFWDEFLKNTNTMLILSGSLVGLMKESILNHSSPLYGRRTGQIHLKNLKPRNIHKLTKNPEKTVKIYSILGGVPKYYEEINLNKSYPEIINDLLKPESFFYEEGTFLLGQEFKTLGNYNSILKSISKGNTELAKISNNIGIETKKLSNYLNTLYELSLIKKEKPITNTKKNYRGYKYRMKDNFLHFWFKFIFPNRNHIERRNLNYNNIKEELKLFTSKKFEDVCKNHTKENYGKVGKWWYKEDEIDIVGLNQNKKEILLGECKWRNKKTGKKTYYQLKEKAEKVRWNQDNRTEEYAIYSKKGFKDELKEISKNKNNIKLYQPKQILSNDYKKK